MHGATKKFKAMSIRQEEYFKPVDKGHMFPRTTSIHW